MLIQAIVEADRELVRRGSLYDFLQMVWPHIDPAPLVLNWHLEEMCKHLEAISRGEIRLLLINVPPGFGKSNLVNVIWNVWEWIHRPTTKFIFASYDSGLVGTRDGGKVLNLLQSEWFRTRWGNLLKRGKAATSDFGTQAGGFRFSTSPAGKATGRHGDIQVVDDPLKPKDAAGGAMQTRTILKAVSDWWSGTMATRATDQRTVRKVMVMQRLHEDDLAGEMILTGEWVHLCLPMIYDPSEPCKTALGGDRRTEPSELLFPERYPLPIVENLRDIKMGPDVFAAQCQQKPVRKGGGIFQRQWWKFWHHLPDVPGPCLCDKCFGKKYRHPDCKATPDICDIFPSKGMDIQSWDCAFKKSDTTDFVAGGTFRVASESVYLIDYINERLSFTGTVNGLKEMSLRYPTAYTKLVEDKANGPAVEDALKEEIPGITLVNPMGGKEARANAGSIFMSSGRFYLPHPDLLPSKVWAFIVQHERFPKAINDDIVDMNSQLLTRLKAHSIAHFEAAMKAIRGEK